MSHGHPSKDFWRGRRVLLTGHTGFKGAWAAMWLRHMGAEVTGLSLAPEPGPNLFSLAGVQRHVDSNIVDVRDAASVRDVITDADPQIIIHMAAQALVRRSYRDPAGTFATNVTGTAHVLDAARALKNLAVMLTITSDKVYDNDGSGGPFAENARLGGHDPYSASKAAAEIVVASYRHSFFADGKVAIATARGGNVIGGGDFSEDRIVPDVWRAHERGEAVVLRYPLATRPWQHVLDCLSGYFTYVEALATRRTSATAINIGPLEKTGLPVKDLVTAMQSAIGASAGWSRSPGEQPPEMPALALNCDLAIRELGWRSRLDAASTISWTADWYKSFAAGEDPSVVTLRQIEAYTALS